MNSVAAFSTMGWVKGLSSNNQVLEPPLLFARDWYCCPLLYSHTLITSFFFRTNSCDFPPWSFCIRYKQCLTVSTLFCLIYEYRSKYFSFNNSMVCFDNRIGLAILLLSLVFKLTSTYINLAFPLQLYFLNPKMRVVKNKVLSWKLHKENWAKCSSLL